MKRNYKRIYRALRVSAKIVSAASLGRALRIADQEQWLNPVYVHRKVQGLRAEQGHKRAAHV